MARNMEKFVTWASTATLFGFAIAFAVLLGLVAQSNDSKRNEDELSRSIGRLALLSASVNVELTNSIVMVAPNAFMISVDHVIEDATDDLDRGGHSGALDTTISILHDARALRRTNATYTSVHALYMKVMRSITSLSAALFREYDADSNDALTTRTLAAKYLAHGAVELSRQREASRVYLATQRRDDLATLMRSASVNNRTLSPNNGVISQYLLNAQYDVNAYSQYRTSLGTILNQAHLMIGTTSGASDIETDIKFQQLLQRRASVNQAYVQKEVDSLNTKLDDKQSRRLVYIVLLIVSLLLSISFFVWNTVQLIRRKTSLQATDVLLKDFDVNDGVVSLKNETMEMAARFTEQMKFMSDDIEGSNEPGQIEITLQKSVSILRELRPFIPRGAMFHEKIPVAAAVARDEDDDEADQASSAAEEVFRPKLNLHTTLSQTPGTIMLVKAEIDAEDELDADVHGNLLEIVKSAIHNRGGIVLHVNEDGIAVLFNANIDEFTQVHECELQATQAAIEIADALAEEEMKNVIAICSAPSLVGNLIGHMTTSFQLVGPATLRSLDLLPVGLRHQVRIVTDSHTVHAISSLCHIRPIYKMDGEEGITAYEIIDIIPEVDEDADDDVKKQIHEAQEKLSDRLAAWSKAWNLYDSAKDHQTEQLDEAARELVNYRNVYVPAGQTDVTLDILYEKVVDKLKEVLGVEYIHEKE
eukprot:PhM_4_TR15216/c0_g1_i1/m.1677